MLLRTGMPVKQAIVYNVVSSVLCFIGMAIGVALGNISDVSLWIFACVGGLFIYIALVDMVSCICLLTNLLTELLIFIWLAIHDRYGICYSLCLVFIAKPHPPPHPLPLYTHPYTHAYAYIYIYIYDYLPLYLMYQV